jgi:hypothetical protein
VSLALYWQALASLPDLEIGTRIVTSGDQGTWTWDVPGRGEYPTSRWLPGRTVVTTHVLTMPASEGEVTVQVAVRRTSHSSSAGPGAPGEPFYPRWLAPETAVLSLPSLAVSGRPPAGPGTVNYGDRILLLEAELGAQTLSPGAPLELYVRWQCLRAMDADYTLFVQLLAPDGTPRGQIDVWPRDGTHPTSAWREGEVIADSYVVYAAEDAPPGRYQVAVGWYLLETMQRLPVLDVEGKEVADRLLLTVVVGE